MISVKLEQRQKIPHAKFTEGWWRQRPAPAPLAGSPQSTGHTIESGSRSAGLGMLKRRRGSGGMKERSP